jgi:hypothetical protein
MVTWCWAHGLSHLAPARARRYVDDITSWFVGAPEDVPLATAAAWEQTLGYATASA